MSPSKRCRGSTSSFFAQSNEKILTVNLHLRSTALSLLLATAACAQTAYQELRYDEDWSYLKDAAKRKDFWDPVKYMEMGKDGWYASFGGEGRIRYEFFRSAGFGSVPNTEYGWQIQRYLAHTDLHMGPYFRVFVQFQSGIEAGRLGGPRATDEDKGEIHQAFIDLNTSADKKKRLTIRLGRQELEFGSGHYLSASEVFNVRRSFDAVRVFKDIGSWTWIALAGHPSETNRGFFDDSPDHTQTIWATGALGPNPWIKGANLSVYYIGFDRKSNRFDQGAGHEVRNTAGTRSWGTKGKLDFNWEFLYQWGQFANTNIRAWAFSTDNGRTWAKAKFAPRVGLRTDLVSGDKNPNDGSLNTFNPLFPTTAYSGRIGLIGAANLIDVSPNLRLRLAKKVLFLPEDTTLFRESTHDGIYGVTGALSRTGQRSNARYVGNQLSLPVVFIFDRHLQWTVALSRFFAGQFLKETPPGHSVTYLTSFLQYKF